MKSDPDPDSFQRYGSAPKCHGSPTLVGGYWDRSNYSAIDLIHWLKEECTVHTRQESSVTTDCVQFFTINYDDLSCTPPPFSLAGLYAAASLYEL
jgi:hypothetical protein